MPTETPHGTRSRTAPSSRPNERPAARSSASRTRHLQRRLGHPVALERRQSAGRRACASTGPAAASAGHEEAAQHVGGPVDVLRGVERVGHRDALAPALGLVGDRAHSRTSRSVWVPNEVRNGETSGIAIAAQLDSGAASCGLLLHDVPAGPVEPVDPGTVGQQRGERLAHRDPPPLRPAPGRATAAPRCRGARRPARSRRRGRPAPARRRADAERRPWHRQRARRRRAPACRGRAAPRPRGSRSRQRTSSRSESSPPLMPSSIGP